MQAPRPSPPGGDRTKETPESTNADASEPHASTPSATRVVDALATIRAGVARALRDDPMLRQAVGALGAWLTSLADGAGRERDAHASPRVGGTANGHGSGEHGSGEHGSGEHGPGEVEGRAPAASAPRRSDEGQNAGNANGAASAGTSAAAANGTTQERTAAPGGHGASRPAATASGLLPLRLGGVRAEVTVSGSSRELISAQRAADDELRRAAEAAAAEHAALFRDELPELSLVAARCALKARACRWSIERRRLLADPRTVFLDRIKPTDQAIVTEARALPNCFAWSLHPYAKLPEDDRLEAIAATYENIAGAARAIIAIDESAEGDRDAFREDAFQLLAEAQSALRWGLADIGEEIDRDQDESFRWLRRKTETDRVFVRRHMRLDDPADYRAWKGLAERIAAFEERRRGHVDGAKARRKALSKIRYICKHLPDWSEEERAGHWRTLAGALDAMVAAGESPSDRELRELLLPVIDEMPDDIDGGAGFHRVMHALDEYIAQHGSAAREARPRERAPTVEVRRVADLLRGTTVLMIGGERRRDAQVALTNAFDLAELRWIGTVDHRSIAPFETEVARPEVALVIIPIRWSNHSFEGIDDFCRKYRKPFVRLPGGYNPNQVAVQVLRQVGAALEARMAEA